MKFIGKLKFNYYNFDFSVNYLKLMNTQNQPKTHYNRMKEIMQFRILLWDRIMKMLGKFLFQLMKVHF